MMSSKWLLQAFLKQQYVEINVMSHIFCPKHHQQNFITRFKLHCRCRHVMKVW